MSKLNNYYPAINFLNLFNLILIFLLIGVVDIFPRSGLLDFNHNTVKHLSLTYDYRKIYHFLAQNNFNNDPVVLLPFNTRSEMNYTIINDNLIQSKSPFYEFNSRVLSCSPYLINYTNLYRDLENRKILIDDFKFIIHDKGILFRSNLFASPYINHSEITRFLKSKNLIFSSGNIDVYSNEYSFSNLKKFNNIMGSFSLSERSLQKFPLTILHFRFSDFTIYNFLGYDYDGYYFVPIVYLFFFINLFFLIIICVIFYMYQDALFSLYFDIYKFFINNIRKFLNILFVRKI